MWRLEDIVRATGGTVLKKDKEIFTNISTDSRTIGPDEFFVPILGKSFDGHAFIEKALARSLGGTLSRADHRVSFADTPGTIVLVEDTNQALLDLARFRRQTLTGKVICITGSNGKTTTKEILVSMMKKRYTVHYNEKNLNNLIGVPLSMLSITGNPEITIMELGTNMPGEIKKLAITCEPEMSLITNVNPSHLEGLFSMEGILEEKLDIFRYTKNDGTLFVNADDPALASRYREIGCQAVTFGIEREADWRLGITRDLGWEGSEFQIATPAGIIAARTSLLGVHNHYNILAAAAIAAAAGVDHPDIVSAIEEFHSYDKRFEPQPSSKGYMIIDDTYNANPSSMQWAIKTLESLPARGKKVAILGGMKELGDQSAHYHREIGSILKSAHDIGLVLLLGEETLDTFSEAGNGKARHFLDRDELIEYAQSHLKSGDTVLVKGSRAFRMEEIVEALA
ncbi:MAG: UDP-N-acetylmuramoyl-tripeptide--D-alanyl-D-alanine ligase [Syntrophorhabdus sp.]